RECRGRRARGRRRGADEDRREAGPARSRQRMILTIKPFGTVDPTILAQLRQELTSFGAVVLAPEASVPDSFVRRKQSGHVQVQASDFETALRGERGDRV